MTASEKSVATYRSTAGATAKRQAVIVAASVRRILPLTTFHFTLVQNIKRDPFEQNVTFDGKSALSIGGAIGAPSTAWAFNFNILPIGQQLWFKHLETFKQFPPLQAPETFNLDQVMAQVKSGSRGNASD
jgi:arylsulfatase